ncbi:MAG: helix-turn-helix domain-containing protein [Pseudomonadota bacterium]
MKARVQEDSSGRRTVSETCRQPCAIEQGMRVLGGKWTGSVLWHLRDEPVRFNDLARMIDGASKKMIADRLRHLETHGLIRREILSTTPVAVQYRITDHGRTALRVLETLRTWSEQSQREIKSTR